MNEAETRAEHIDPALKAAGWGVVAGSRIRRNLYDVLAYVCYATARLTRRERADQAQKLIRVHFGDRQRQFIDFVLSHYVAVGVAELDQEKLPPLLRLKYRDSIADALANLGPPDDITRAFIGFQKYLYA